MVPRLRGDDGKYAPASAPRRGVFISAIFLILYTSRAGIQRSIIPMHPILRTVILLTLSNVFMTFAWYAHLKHLNQKPWVVAALASWGIALFEYLLQVPANRIGYTVLTLPQLKILQEVITLTVFVPFVLMYMKQPLKLDYLWASLCMLGAVYFIFRK
jgi:uncharacterized protein (DUF486 family)